MIRALGIGDNVVDKYLHTMTMYPGGNAFNFAVYARLFGMDAGYMGNFGDDQEGRHVYDTARGLKVDVSHCRFWEGENGAARVKLENGDRVFLGSNKGGISNQHPLKLTRLDQSYIQGFDLVHTSIFSHLEEELPLLGKTAAFLSMDFSNYYTDEYLEKTCPHLDCACISCGEAASEEEILAEIKKIREYGCRHMVIATRGAKGAFVSVDGEVYRQSPCLVRARDTMGAGDSFITCFLVNYIDGMQFAEDFPENSGSEGMTTICEYKKVVIETSLYKAAVFSARNCQKDGSFGFGVPFTE